MIVATRNEHKLRELREALPGIDLDPLPDEVELPPEEGDTFAENALGKALAAREATGRIAIADDSGIEARRAGRTPRRALGALCGRGRERRAEPAEAARRASRPAGQAPRLCLRDRAGRRAGDEELFEGRCEGTLVDPPRGSGGFGYDPAFLPDDTDPGDQRTFGELPAAEKHAISHRGRAARMLARSLGVTG